MAIAGLSFTVSHITIAGLAVGTASALIVYAQTGSVTEALTYSPLGIFVAPVVRALSRIINHPDGLMVKSVLKQHIKHNLRIRISRELLKSYLGDEPCWVKIKVKERTFSKVMDQRLNSTFQTI